MSKQKFIESAKHVFNQNPEVKELHFTSNGQAFQNKHYANLHAKELPSKEVITITPDDVKGKKAIQQD